MVNFKGVDKLTWTRIIALFILLINQISISFFDFKVIPFEDDQIYEGVSLLLTVLITIWTTWKNNSFTTEAQITDKQLKKLKS